MERRDKINYYLDLAKMVAQRSTCLRRHYGAVIVKNDEVISTGYVGAPRGRKNCTDIGECVRVRMEIPRGERYELCRSVHAEANAIISASRDKMIGSALYLVGVEAGTGEYVKDSCSCSMCKRQIINAGLRPFISGIRRMNTGLFLCSSGLMRMNPWKVSWGIDLILQANSPIYRRVLDASAQLEQADQKENIKELVGE